MNWRYLRHFPWLDTRARFVSRVPGKGTLLDVGCSSGGTLNHFVELRPDLHFLAVDMEDFSQSVPAQADFHQLDIVTGELPFASETVDAITLLHVMEHLPVPGVMPGEFCRVLKPSGRLYVEGPGARSLYMPKGVKGITFNFYDDPTHIAPLDCVKVADVFEREGFQVIRRGVSRSWPLILGIPWSLISRDRLHFLAGIIHLVGWSVCVEFRKPWVQKIQVKPLIPKIAADEESICQLSGADN